GLARFDLRLRDCAEHSDGDHHGPDGGKPEHRPEDRAAESVADANGASALLRGWTKDERHDFRQRDKDDGCEDAADDERRDEIGKTGGSKKRRGEVAAKNCDGIRADECEQIEELPDDADPPAANDLIEDKGCG